MQIVFETWSPTHSKLKTHWPHIWWVDVISQCPFSTLGLITKFKYLGCVISQRSYFNSVAKKKKRYFNSWIVLRITFQLVSECQVHSCWCQGIGLVGSSEQVFAGRLLGFESWLSHIVTMWLEIHCLPSCTLVSLIIKWEK